MAGTLPFLVPSPDLGLIEPFVVPHNDIDGLARDLAYEAINGLKLGAAVCGGYWRGFSDTGVSGAVWQIGQEALPASFYFSWRSLLENSGLFSFASDELRADRFIEKEVAREKLEDIRRLEKIS